MRKYRLREQGFTLITIVIILFLIGFFAMLILKIGPIYMNNMKVRSSLQAIKNTTDISSKSKQEVVSLLNKRFDVNYVDFIDKNDIKITKHGNYLKVEIAYEVIENIAGNLDVLVTFNEVIEAGNQ